MKKLGLFVMPLVAASFLVGCGNSPTPTDNYKFTFDGKNCSATNEDNYKKDANVKFDISANANYVLPEKASVTVTGLTSTWDYQLNSDKTSATFTCIMPANEVKVTVEAIEPKPTSYSFALTKENCTVTPEPETKYKEGEEISFEVEASEGGYVLPDSITTNLQKYEYELAQGNKTATFKCIMPANDVTVTIKAYIPTPTLYSFALTKENCTVTPEPKTQYKQGQEISFSVSAMTGATLPEKIEVTGTSSYNYARTSTTAATFNCIMPASDVTVEIKATVDPTPDKYKMTFNGTNCTADNQTTYDKNADISFTITAIDDCTLPTKEKITVEGITDYTYTLASGNKSATFACKMTADVKVTVDAIVPIPTHSFTFTGTNCTSTAETSYEEGAQIAFNINANDDYILPPKGSALITTNLQNYEYELAQDKRTATFKCTMPTFNVEVKITAISMYHTFTFNGEHCTSTAETSYKEGENITFTINAASEYVLPEKTLVTVTGLDTWDYQLNSDKTSATFTCTMPTNNVEVKVEAIQKLYSFTLTKENCTVDKDPSGDYLKGASISFEITVSVTGYVLPTKDKLGVTGIDLSSITYELSSDNTSATFTCTMPASNVTVEITATEPPKIPDYLCFTCNSDTGTLGYSAAKWKTESLEVDLSYSTDGINWTPIAKPAIQYEQIEIIKLNKGESVYIRGNNPDGFSISSYGSDRRNLWFTTESTDDFSISGNIMSLLKEEDFETVEAIPSPGCFISIFGGLYGSDCAITDASGLLLSAKYLSNNCYQNMFCECEKLTSVPSISAVTLSESCFEGMFIRCSSIVNVPSDYLPYTNLASGCYCDMFKGCESLTSVITLPAKMLKDKCYYGMFSGCKSITQVPELPATTLADSCYAQMFEDTSITSAPALISTTLAPSCYLGMFCDCTLLETAPELPAPAGDLLANYCYANMFENCKSLTSAPSLPCKTMSVSCYSNMFKGCESLETAPELPATTLNTACYNNMFDGCISLETAPELPATTMFPSCYKNMFSGCTSLTEGPEELPSIKGTDDYCYAGMFKNCESLETAPVLPSVSLSNNCYCEMFSGCTSLTEVQEELPATTLTNSCYSYMFSGCSSLKKAPKLSATSTAYMCYKGMFDGCESLNISEGTGVTKFFECPNELKLDSVVDMFAKTGGSFKGTPVAGRTYYFN